jgi:hypothetical protein
VNSHTHTGSGLLASRLTIRTRCRSASALNSDAVVAASSSDRTAAASGAQHAAAGEAGAVGVVVVIGPGVLR